MRKKLHNPKSHAPAIYIPCWLSQVPVNLLSHGAKLVYGRLSQWCTETGLAFRSAPQLAEELGMCESSVKKYQKELRDVELLGTFHPQAGGVNHFEFYDHPWMHEPINENLVYKTDKYDPVYDHTLPRVRSEPTPVYDHTRINKNEIKEIKCVGDESTHTQNLTQLKKEKAEQQALECEEAKIIFEAKFSDREVTINQIFEDCKEHYEQKSRWAKKSDFIKWLKREEPDNYKKLSVTKLKTETDEQRKERQYFEYELIKERDNKGYVSDALKKYPEMRQKYA